MNIFNLFKTEEEIYYQTLKKIVMKQVEKNITISNLKIRVMTLNSLASRVFFFSILLGTFFNAVAQIDKNDYYDAGYSPTSFRKKQRLEYKENERLFLEYEKESAFVKVMDSSQILNVFYHLKTNSLYYGDNSSYKEFAINRKKQLINYSIYCLQNQKAVGICKYEMINFLESCIAKRIVTCKISANKKGYSLDNIIKSSEYNINSQIGFTDFNEIERDLFFLKMLRDSKKISDEELSKGRKTFLASNESLRALDVLFEQTSRGGSKNDISFQMLEDLSNMSNIALDFYSSTYFNNRKHELISAMNTNNDFVIKYCEMLLSKNQVDQAYNYALLAPSTPEVKYIIMECKRIKFGINAAMDYLMEQKPKPTTITDILREKADSLSGQDKLDLTKYLINKYKTLLDSVDITAIAGFHYWRSGDIMTGGQEIFTLPNKKDVFYFVKLYKDYGYDYESSYIETQYWAALQLSVSEIQKNVGNKSLKPKIAAAILLTYGIYCTEEKANGSRNRDMLINECIPILKKAATYDPKNGYIYKALGDSYSYYGNGMCWGYYDKALALGADLSDRVSRSGKGGGKGGKNILKGSRGGKYYINGNGNKTYINQ
jgi:hypothetical protein